MIVEVVLSSLYNSFVSHTKSFHDILHLSKGYHCMWVDLIYERPFSVYCVLFNYSLYIDEQTMMS